MAKQSAKMPGINMKKEMAAEIEKHQVDASLAC